ncbi:MFS transporter [Staphylococcus simulans]
MNNKIVILACSMGIFICMLDVTIMNISLPAIQKDLNISLKEVSWALNIYTILFSALTIPVNKLGTIFGRNRFYMVGLFIFLLGSIFCSISNTIVMLIISRGVQSIGAAIVFPTSTVIAIDYCKNKKLTIALLGITQGLAAAIGPVSGGILTQFMGWRWIFIINIPIVLVSLIICTFLLPTKVEKRQIDKVDILGGVLCFFNLLLIVIILLNGKDWGWLSKKTVVFIIINIVIFIAFIYYEKHVKNPMMPFNLFKNRNFLCASIVMVLSNFYLVGVTILLPTYLTKINNQTELTAALLITPISVMIFFISPISSLLLNRIPTKLIICTGFITISLSYYLFSSINYSKSYIGLVISCVILGIGYGIIIGPLTVIAASNFRGEELNSSQSIIGVFRQIGIVIAVAVFVSSLTSNVKESKRVISNHVQNEIHRTDLPNSLKEVVSKVFLNRLDKDYKTENSEEKSMGVLIKQVTLQETNNYKGVGNENKHVQISIQNDIKRNVNIVERLKENTRQFTDYQLEEAFKKIYRIWSPIILVTIGIGLLFKNQKLE